MKYLGFVLIATVIAQLRLPVILAEEKAYDDDVSILLSSISGAIKEIKDESIMSLSTQESECGQRIHMLDSQHKEVARNMQNLQAKIADLQSKTQMKSNFDENIKSLTVKIALLKQAHIDDTAEYQHRVEDHKKAIQAINAASGYLSSLYSSFNDKAKTKEGLEKIQNSLKNLKNELENSVELETQGQMKADADYSDLLSKLGISLNDLTNGKVHTDEKMKMLTQQLEEGLGSLQAMESQSQVLSEALTSERTLCSSFKEIHDEEVHESESQQSLIDSVLSA